MTSIDAHLLAVSEAIDQNITALGDNRPLLAQNLLAQLRTLVECVAVKCNSSDGAETYSYDAIKPAIKYVQAHGQLNFISRFHKFLQISTSHYTFEGDISERLIIRYYELLLKVRTIVRSKFGMSILENLEYFPVDLDPSLREYHHKIARRINEVRTAPEGEFTKGRYYILKISPFVHEGQVYYEVTFQKAINKVNKFDRMIAFTDLDLTSKYAANLTLMSKTIDVLGQDMPIMIIQSWEISIRPCEFNNFGMLLGISIRTNTGSVDYKNLMKHLSDRKANLLDLIDLPDQEYMRLRTVICDRVSESAIFQVLDEARRIIMADQAGKNLLRFLILRMNNQIIKKQHNYEACARLSNLHVSFGCIPFDTMPYCTSPIGHNPHFSDIQESIDVIGREHELLARRVRNNVEQRGMMYTPIGELSGFNSIEELITTYNSMLYYKHQGRRLVFEMGHVFIQEYETETLKIIETLRLFTSVGVNGYGVAVQQWIRETSARIDDPIKEEALKELFELSRVALIYGAAGTGKSTMVNYIAQNFIEKRKLFLAQTNPAVENLRRRVIAQNSEFRTIKSHLSRSDSWSVCDVLIIDECSTVSNSDLLGVLETTTTSLLVLVGDVYQIESIQFGNWFSLMRAFVPDPSVFELTTPFRTTNGTLLDLWSKVRNLELDIAEAISRHGFSNVLDESLFESREEDEIILCLNYDGLYGINNINRFLQSSNPERPFEWGINTYKVGDPVLFTDTERFRPVIYNNLKGTLVRIEVFDERIQFDVKLSRAVTEFDVQGTDLTWIGDATVRFSVYQSDDGDEDDDSIHTTVPFQVAYAVSIHKAQGLEYDSVKVVIANGVEDRITHNIFYTAITRARQQLRIYWSPETQNKILGSLERDTSKKDLRILVARSGLAPSL